MELNPKNKTKMTISRTEIKYTGIEYDKIEFQCSGTDYYFDREIESIKKELAYGSRDVEDVTPDEIRKYICDHPDLWKELKE